MQRYEERAEEDFFCYGTGDVVTPADPAAKSFEEVMALDP